MCTCSKKNRNKGRKRERGKERQKDGDKEGRKERKMFISTLFKYTHIHKKKS